MTNPASGWSRLPEELKALKQWCIAGADKVPLAVDAQSNIIGLSVIDPSSWMTFSAAAHAAYGRGLHIGFILSKNDPYTCIDFDVKDSTNEPDASKHTTTEQHDRFWHIVQTFDSYTERSRSGKGLHTWVRGKIGKGVRRDGVEIYSQERYIISTGDVIIDKGIQERQDLLNILASEMSARTVYAEFLVEHEQTEDDSVILERAWKADNGEKFKELYLGNWQLLGFPSQSEADLALMSMFTFYSASNEQCRRLFRQSELGKREKAQKDNRYLDYTLRAIRGRQEREQAIDLSAIRKAMELAQAYTQKSTPLNAHNILEPIETPPPPSASVVLSGPVSQAVAEAETKESIPWPPGMTGAIAQFIYESAPRPIKEVAIITSIGFLAGICGKAWTFTRSGLNMYLILVGRSAIGKEAMHTGMSSLITAIAQREPAAVTFVDFAEYVSSAALRKALAVNPCFVNVVGEWGQQLQRLSNLSKADAQMQALRRTIIDLYQKSSHHSIVGGLKYSKQEDSVGSVSGVAYSMIGETTPSTFYEALTHEMMENGFLSRFTIIEYDGPRPPLNKNQVMEPSKVLGDALAELCRYSLTCIAKGAVVEVSKTEEVREIIDKMEIQADAAINSTSEEMWRQMWNRSSLKAMKLASLLAVADNWIHPVIKREHIDWAMDVVQRDIKIMTDHINKGDVGDTDDSRDRKLRSIIVDYLRKPNASYRIPAGMREAGIIPHTYFQVRCSSISAFNKHRVGTRAAMDATIKSLIEGGYLKKLSPTSIPVNINFSGTCYAITNIDEL